MKPFLLIFVFSLLTGCRGNVTIKRTPTKTPQYYQIECDDDSCQLTPRFGDVPTDSEKVGETEDKYPIYKVPTPLSREPIIPSREQPETFRGG